MSIRSVTYPFGAAMLTVLPFQLNSVFGGPNERRE
jgi:hypothetical protein